MKLIVNQNDIKAIMSREHNLNPEDVELELLSDADYIKRLLRMNKKLEAIKFVRDSYGLGLKEANDFCELVATKLEYVPNPEHWLLTH